MNEIRIKPLVLGLLVIFFISCVRLYFQLLRLDTRVDYLENNIILKQKLNERLKLIYDLQTDVEQLGIALGNLKNLSTKNVNDNTAENANKEEAEQVVIIKESRMNEKDEELLKEINEKLNIFISLNESNAIPLARILKSSIKSYMDSKSKTDKHKPNTKIFDLTQPLEPSETYKEIQCKESAKFVVQTVICVHELEKDVYVSKDIWELGSFEGEILKAFTNYLSLNPDWLVIDIGAHVGQYTLFAAKMGHHVISIEPYLDNILRIHKASTIEKTNKFITLFQNGISNRRNELKVLLPDNSNIGGLSFLEVNNNNKFNLNNLPSKNYAETILLDDILDSIPKNKEFRKYEKAIIKIDIEGFEPFAFLNARRLFDSIQVQVVFMEWKLLPRQIENHNIIIQLIEFLSSYNLNPYDKNELLVKDNWKRWPDNIIWKRNNV